MNKFLKVLLISFVLSGCQLPTIGVNSNINSTNSSYTSSSNINSSSNNDSTNISVNTNSNTNSNSSISSSEDKESSSILLEDPYVGMSSYDFYKNYKEASSYEDAQYRTKHGFMSGSINYGSYIPTENTLYSGDKFLKFNNYNYTYDSNNNPISYKINTKEGTYKTIYYNAAYVVLEEVAAYILAFGEVPPNNNYSKNDKDKSINTWGKYGRVNIGNYSNDVNRYPNEPELPLKDSKGKSYQYIETDIGLESYNNGSKITRGTNRIVFTGKYKDGSKVSDVNERYVFYTYNHYEDFQEYLNYYNGWGDRFGYEEGNYSKPTPHIEALIVDKNSI